jgi:hypothetical protein
MGTCPAAFTPCVEIGWRLSADHWNRGLATEGAKAIVRHAYRLHCRDFLRGTTAGNTKAKVSPLGCSSAEGCSAPVSPGGRKTGPGVTTYHAVQEAIRFNARLPHPLCEL